MFFDISIHSPLAGRDPVTAWRFIVDIAFQSTRPSRGETIAVVNFAKPHHIFQSTRPSRGETVTGYYQQADSWISIHSPLAGRDGSQILRGQGHHDFNPLAPRGARRGPPFLASIVSYFNPLAPRGARRVTRYGLISSGVFQSTRPSRGETGPLPLRAA